MHRLCVWAVLCGVVVLNNVEGSVPYLKCNIYFRNEVIPDIQNADRFCYHQSNDVRFCRDAPCPSLTCEIPEEPSSFSNCRYCLGQCVHGGQVYGEGQRFKHMDGVNHCTCYDDNVLMCSKMAATEQNVCI